MKLKPDQRSFLQEYIINHFTQNEFVDLIKNSSISIAYDIDVRVNVNYRIGVGNFLDELQSRGNEIHDLVSEIITKRGTDTSLSTFITDYKNTYVAGAGTLKINPQIFEKQLLQNRILNIGRDEFGKYFEQMINDESCNLLVLRGKPQCGISHTTTYFGELETELNTYQQVYLNLRRLGEIYPNEKVSAAHLADRIASSINMANFPGVKEFKLGTFLGKFEPMMVDFARKGNRWLFFIDQFDYPHSDDVKTMIKAMTEILASHPGAFYLIVSEYKGWENDWSDIARNLAEEFDFKQFTRDDVNTFLEKLYNCLETKFREKQIDITKKVSRDVFVQSAHILLPDEKYAEDKGSNVPVISNALHKWYRGTVSALTR